MKVSDLHVVFAGGGTAGHLFPGLAVAQELAAMAESPRISFAGGGKSLEAILVAKAGFEYRQIDCAPLPRGVHSAILFMTRNVLGYRSARRWLRRQKASIVVGLGGYTSVPICRAAISNGLPLVLLEQNAIPGRATRWLARRADLICTAFDQARSHLRCVAPVRCTGNPIRAGFRRPKVLRPFLSGRNWRHRLLVLGGSGGAHALNESVPRALYKLRDRLDEWQIVHQCGPRDVAFTKELYRKLMIEAIVVPFVENLPAVLRRTDLAVGRAGGTTLAELAATGVPAVLVPYPHATDDHQRRNADVFVAAGAARMIEERMLEGRLDDAIHDALDDLLDDQALRQSLSTSMFHLARPEAAWQVATMVRELADRIMERKAA